MATAQTEKILFSSSVDSLFRIPVIASTPGGKLIALSDHRYTHGYDVGWGKPIDVMYRVSNDWGKTWSRATNLIECSSSVYGEGIYGFGDAAMVTDRSSGETLVLCVGDRLAKSYQQRGREEVHAFYLKNDNQKGGLSFYGHLNLTDQIYSLVDDWKCLFIASGKIFQSRVIKIGKYYRLYCAALVADKGDYVLYSDDFGKNWSLLGDATSPCPKGDEAKVEELPDGTVILSSRTEGRLFNFFRYDSKSFTTGSWDKPVLSEDIKTIDNATNGEILCLKVKNTETGKKEYLYLQSVPYGPDRSHVSIYYKSIPSMKDCKGITPQEFGSGWKRYEVTDKGSAYSTMCLQKDGSIGFIYERNGADVNGYDIVYETLTVSTITNGQFK